jgi:hypothetical protein
MKFLLCLSGLLLFTSCGQTPEFGAKDELSIANDGVKIGDGDVAPDPSTPTEEPGTVPPVTEPPVVTIPPIVTPPIVTVPPVVTPPVETVPPVVTIPPVTTPPVVTVPPVTTPPVVTVPPVTTPPVVTVPPVTTPPVVTVPPVTTPPVVSVPPVTTPPVVSIPPVTTPPVVSIPPVITPPVVTGPSCGKKDIASICKYTFTATHVDSGVNITVISGPISKLSKISDFAYEKLSAEDKAFVVDALANTLTLPSVTAINETTQTISDKFLVKNTNNASVNLTSIHEDTKLNYALKGATASIKATSVAMNSKIIAVLDGKSSSVNFTSLGKGAQVFLVYITQGDNITCINTTASSGNIHSYVYGESDKVTQSQIKSTSIRGSSLIQYVSGNSNTRATLTGASIRESKVNIKVEGLGMNVGSKNSFTGIGDSNIFDISVNGQDQSDLSLLGKCIGKNNIVNMSLVGNKDVKAGFSFTGENNIKILGSMTGISPTLNLSKNLLNSKEAIVNVSKIEK